MVAFRNIMGGVMLFGSLVVGVPRTTAKVAGRGVQYPSWALKNLFTATEFIGEKVGNGGAWAEAKAFNVRKYSLDLLDSRKNEYRDLKINYEWRGKLLEDNWVKVDTFNKK